MRAQLLVYDPDPTKARDRVSILAIDEQWRFSAAINYGINETWDIGAALTYIV
jgi:long-subunit fatty acid transport protein